MHKGLVSEYREKNERDESGKKLTKTRISVPEYIEEREESGKKLYSYILVFML